MQELEKIIPKIELDVINFINSTLVNILSMKYYQSFFILFLLCTVLACSRPEDELEQMISRSLMDNQGLSAKECNAIHGLISKHKSLYEEFEEESDLKKLVEQIAEKMSKRKSRPIDFPLAASCFGAASIEKHAYNVYLENSASMDGYYQGNTEFKAALYNLLTRINVEKESVSLHFINEKILPIQKEVRDFISSLSSSSLAVGDRKSSKLDKILEKVVGNYQSDGKPGILVSDYIFSLNNNADLGSELDKIKYTIANTCESLDKDKDAILVMKFSSAFNGLYFDMYNKNHKLSGKDRPFYFWLIGSKTLIHNFMKKYGVEGIEGFQDYLILDHSTEEEKPYQALLSHTLKKGRFNICRDQAKELCIENIEFYDRDKPPVLKFALGIDLSKIPLSPSAKLSTDAYIVVSERGDLIEVESVHLISVAEDSDERFKGTATHILVLNTKSLYRGEQEVKLRMKKEIPTWVVTTHTDKDTDIENSGGNQTFGFRYLIEGVNFAFNPNTAFYFEVPITIRNN
jgi:hypothetical protein